MNRWFLVAGGVVGVALILRPSRSRRRVALTSPLDGELVVTPHGDYGASRGGPPRHTHQGIDLSAKPGAFVRAIGDGVIVAANPGLGKLVRKLKLDTPAAYLDGQTAIAFVVYADLGSALREPGEHVKEGEPIAVVGTRRFFHFACKHLVKGREQFFDPALAGLRYRTNQERVSA